MKNQMKGGKILAAAIAFGVASFAEASAVVVNVAGNLSNGGTYSGSFSYDSNATDTNALNPNEGAFDLTGFDIYVDSGAPSTSQHFVKNPVTDFGFIARYDGSLANIISVYIQSFLPSTNATLVLTFLDLGQTPSPYSPNIAPNVADFGALQTLIQVDTSGFGLSAYDYLNFGVSSSQLFSYVTSATVTAAVPEPATLALFSLGLAGIGAIRRKRLAA